MVLWCVREDGVLEVDSMGNDAVVFIHPEKKYNKKYITMINNCYAWINMWSEHMPITPHIVCTMDINDKLSDLLKGVADKKYC